MVPIWPKIDCIICKKNGFIIILYTKNIFERTFCELNAGQTSHTFEQSGNKIFFLFAISTNFKLKVFDFEIEIQVPSISESSG